MANILNASVPVVIDKERSLLYGAAAFIDFKEATGRDLLVTFQSVIKTVKKGTNEDGTPNDEYQIPVQELCDILWAGLIHEDEALTRRQIYTMMTPGRIFALMKDIVEAFHISIGMSNERPILDQRPRKAPARTRKSTGANSGALHELTSGSPGVSSAS